MQHNYESKGQALANPIDSLESYKIWITSLVCHIYKAFALRSVANRPYVFGMFDNVFLYQSIKALSKDVSL